MDLKMNTELLRAASGPPPPAAVLPVKCGLNRTHWPEEGAAGVGALPRACRVWPHPGHGIASPGLSFPVTACAQTGLRDSQDLPGRFWPPRPAAPSARL